MIYKAHKGARIDLQVHNGTSVLSYVFEFYNNDGTVMDLSVYTGIDLKIRYDKGQTIVNTYSLSSGLVRSSNTISWTMPKADTEKLQLRQYWHEMTATVTGGEVDLLFYGTTDVL